MSTVRVGVAGAAGYTGGELLRLLLAHPEVEIIFAHSNSSAGKKWYEVHHDLLGRTERGFTAGISQDIDVLFLCVGHKEARKFLDKHSLNSSIRIIDLSTDFRHRNDAHHGERQFVYGLPELNKEKIKEAQNIANPGCFATAIELALLPLASANQLRGDISVNATTGSTGAGQKATETSHFSWRDSNLSVYKAFTHQHLKEIKESLNYFQAELPSLNFIPQRGNFSRGILAAVTMKVQLEQWEIEQLYNEFYKDAEFTCLAPFDIDLKQVVNTNFCYLQLIREGDNLLIISVIDNLLKGASGQAIQNMNLMFGFKENTGLQLKASAF